MCDTPTSQGAALLGEEEEQQHKHDDDDGRPPLWWEQVLYGLPGLPNHLIQKFQHLWLDLYYIGTLNAPLLDLALFDTILNGGLMLFLPAFGSFSDRLATRWGRRRPIMAVLAPLAALGFLGLMWVPAETMTVVILWYMGMNLLQRCQILLQLCYRALGVQMALKSYQRTRVLAWASAFGGIGLMAGTAVPTYLETEWDYRIFGLAVAGSIIAFYGLLVLLVKERPDLGQSKEGQEIVPTILQSFQNYPFVLYLLSQVKDTLSLQETYAFKWLFHLDKHQIFFAFLTTFGSAFLVSLVWTKMGPRIENRTGAILGFVCTIFSIILSFCVPAQVKSEFSFGVAILHCFLEGVGVGSRNTFLPAIAADCIEYDQLLHGNRREAQYKTVEDMVTTLYGTGYGLSLALLGAAGFNTKLSVQLETVLWVMRGLQFVKITTHVLGVIFLYKFPITHRLHKEITQQIIVRGKGLPAIDPITGNVLPPTAHAAPASVRSNLDHFALWEWRFVHAHRSSKGLVLLVMAHITSATALLLSCLAAAILTSFRNGTFQGLGAPHEEQGGADSAWLVQIEITGCCLALAWLLFNFLRLPALLTIIRSWNLHKAWLPGYLGCPPGDQQGWNIQQEEESDNEKTFFQENELLAPR